MHHNKERNKNLPGGGTLIDGPVTRAQNTESHTPGHCYSLPKPHINTLDTHSVTHGVIITWNTEK